MAAEAPDIDRHKIKRTSRKRTKLHSRMPATALTSGSEILEIDDIEIKISNTRVMTRDEFEEIRMRI